MVLYKKQQAFLIQLKSNVLIIDASSILIKKPYFTQTSHLHSPEQKQSDLHSQLKTHKSKVQLRNVVGFCPVIGPHGFRGGATEEQRCSSLCVRDLDSHRLLLLAGTHLCKTMQLSWAICK